MAFGDPEDSGNYQLLPLNHLQGPEECRPGSGFRRVSFFNRFHIPGLFGLVLLFYTICKKNSSPHI
jgi:hypothetical protein